MTNPDGTAVGDAGQQGWFDINLPADVDCFYTVTVQTALPQSVVLRDGMGAEVFSASGSLAQPGPGVVASGFFRRQNTTLQRPYQIGLFVDAPQRHPANVTWWRITPAQTPNPVVDGFVFSALAGPDPTNASLITQIYWVPSARPAVAPVATLMVFDTEGLLAAYPNPSQDSGKPTEIGGNFIFLLTEHEGQPMGEAGDVLVLTAPIGTELRFREASLSLRGEQTALIYRFAPLDANDTLAADALIDPLHPVTAADRVEGIPDAINLQAPALTQADDYFWCSHIRASGQAAHALDFMVLNRNGDTLGYFRWLVTIVI